MNKVYVLAIAMLIVSCTVHESYESNTIKVGVVGPLTGDFAIYGEDLRSGVELAKDKINSEGGINGKKIELIYEDACLPKDAISAAKKLVDVDEVDSIINFCIIGAIPISTVTEPEKIPLFLVAAVPDNVIEAGEHIFSPNVAIKLEAKAKAEFAYHTLNARTASIVYLTTDLGVSYSENFAKYFEELGGGVLTNEELEIYGTDFRTQLTKVKNANPDLLLGIHIGNQASILLRQRVELGIKAPMLGFYEGESPVILEGAGKYAEEFIVSTFDDQGTATQREFRSEFIKDHEEFPSVITMNAYDSLSILAYVFSKCSDNLCVKTEIYNIKDYEGVGGTFSIGKAGTAEKKFIFKQVRNGKFEPY